MAEDGEMWGSIPEMVIPFMKEFLVGIDVDDGEDEGECYDDNDDEEEKEEEEEERVLTEREKHYNPNPVGKMYVV